MVSKKQPSERAAERTASERVVTVSLPDDLIAQLQRLRRPGGAPAAVEELVREAVAGYVAGETHRRQLPEPKLSRRQRQVLEMIARGRTTKEIAQHLGISIKTADWHRGQLMKNLDLHGVVEVVRYAIRAGIIQA